jgi:hypothetical protein
LLAVFIFIFDNILKEFFMQDQNQDLIYDLYLLFDNKCSEDVSLLSLKLCDHGQETFNYFVQMLLEQITDFIARNPDNEKMRILNQEFIEKLYELKKNNSSLLTEKIQYILSQIPSSALIALNLLTQEERLSLRDPFLRNFGHQIPFSQTQIDSHTRRIPELELNLVQTPNESIPLEIAIQTSPLEIAIQTSRLNLNLDLDLDLDLMQITESRTHEPNQLKTQHDDI